MSNATATQHALQTPPPGYQPTTAVVYTRISPRPHDGEPSMEKQEGDCRNCAKARGLRVLRVFNNDYKRSGKTFEGREVLDAIEFAKLHWAVLIVYDLSRLSRNFKDQAL